MNMNAKKLKIVIDKEICETRSSGMTKILGKQALFEL